MQSSKRDTINKVIADIATKQETEEVVNWFATSIEGQQHLSDLMDRDAYIMESEPYTGNSFTSSQSDQLYKRIDKKIKTNQFKRITLKVAAVIVPLLIIAGLGFFLSNDTILFGETVYSEVYVPKGEDARIYFQDGTEVYLNADTRIRYPEKFGRTKREVYLDGEAYFNVKTNARKPFVVYAQDTKTEVSGTSFNVNAYKNSNTVQVVLDEGKTCFHVHSHSYPMMPGQRIEYDKTTARTTLSNMKHPSHASLWKKNTLCFYDTPLGEVMKVLERKFNVEFEQETPEVMDYSYTLTTKQPSIEGVLLELQKIAPVKFKVEGTTVIASF